MHPIMVAERKVAPGTWDSFTKSSKRKQSSVVEDNSELLCNVSWIIKTADAEDTHNKCDVGEGSVWTGGGVCVEGGEGVGVCVSSL